MRQNGRATLRGIMRSALGQALRLRSPVPAPSWPAAWAGRLGDSAALTCLCATLACGLGRPFGFAQGRQVQAGQVLRLRSPVPAPQVQAGQALRLRSGQAE